LAKRAWIAGATGLVGSALVRQAAQRDDYDEVIALVRSPADFGLAKVRSQVVEFEHLDLSQVPAHDVFCAL
jgi:uncharacterized protein YbjT (DUF2867 family)